MPKGVEHSIPVARIAWRVDVKVPLMPKGVEHPSSFTSSPAVGAVKVPLMPKGVEHTFEEFVPAFGHWCESTFDAERR